jgi:hypothetical protein
MFNAWWTVFSKNEVTVSEILERTRESIPRYDREFDSKHPELRDAVFAICGDRLESRRLGGWLRRHRNSIADGLQLKQADIDRHAKVAKWKVAPAGFAE